MGLSIYFPLVCVCERGGVGNEKRKKSGLDFQHPACNLPSPLRKFSLNALFTVQKVKEHVMKEKMGFVFRGDPFLYLLNHQECIFYLIPQDSLLI